MHSYENVCWYCGKTVSTEFCWKCPKCGWLICPSCGHCKDIKHGDCSENAKGLARYIGVFRKVNILKNMLDDHDCLTIPLFEEMGRIETEQEYAKFKDRHSDLIKIMEKAYFEEKEAKKQEQKEKQSKKQKEYIMNQQGYYKIIYQGQNYTTYRKYNDLNYTIYGKTNTIGDYIYIKNKK